MARTHTLRDLPPIREIQTLGKANDETAQMLLKTAARVVEVRDGPIRRGDGHKSPMPRMQHSSPRPQPLMRRRHLTAAVLKEFYPHEPNLLGLNVDGGAEIRVRLRRAGRFLDFLSQESIIGTLVGQRTGSMAMGIAVSCAAA